MKKFNTKILDISNSNISGELDLKKYIKLHKLDCSNNKITKIINIPKTLSYLNCSHNLIEEITNITDDLQYFNCAKNPIKILYYPFNIKPNKYPKTLLNLIFGQNFNQSVDNLPNSITHLNLGYSFNQSVDNLPNSITHLTFEGEFNQSIDNLPNLITHLTFDNDDNNYFNQLINNLPNSITHLTLGSNFNQSIDNLPNSITNLIINNDYDLHELNDDPFECCVFNNKINNLPKNLKKLEYGYDHECSANGFTYVYCILENELNTNDENIYKCKIDICRPDINFIKNLLKFLSSKKNILIDLCIHYNGYDVIRGVDALYINKFNKLHNIDYDNGEIDNSEICEKYEKYLRDIFINQYKYIKFNSIIFKGASD